MLSAIFFRNIEFTTGNRRKTAYSHAIARQFNKMYYSRTPDERPSLLYDHISCDVVGAAQHI